MSDGFVEKSIIYGQTFGRVTVMESSRLGIVIKVKNLELCKAFYRDILDLGQPVLDSSFWVEFKVSPESSLYLEKAEWDEPVPEAGGKIAWLYRTERLSKIREKLGSYGYSPSSACTDKVGFEVYRFADPEGNPFYIAPRL